MFIVVFATIYQKKNINSFVAHAVKVEIINLFIKVVAVAAVAAQTMPPFDIQLFYNNQQKNAVGLPTATKPKGKTHKVPKNVWSGFVKAMINESDFQLSMPETLTRRNYAEFFTPLIQLEECHKRWQYFEKYHRVQQQLTRFEESNEVECSFEGRPLNFVTPKIIVGDLLFARSNKDERLFVGRISSIYGNTIRALFCEDFIKDHFPCDPHTTFDILIDFQRTPFKRTLTVVHFIGNKLKDNHENFGCFFPEKPTQSIQAAVDNDFALQLNELQKQAANEIIRKIRKQTKKSPAFILYKFIRHG